MPFHVLDPIDFFAKQFDLAKFLVVNKDIKVKCGEYSESDCAWPFSYPLKCDGGEKFFVYLIYPSNRQQIPILQRTYLNLVKNRFHKDKKVCPKMVKTLKQG